MDRHDLNRVFDQLVPTREQEEDVLARLLQTERKVIYMKKPKKWMTAGIAAALTLALVTCAAASAPLLSKLFQITPLWSFNSSEEGIDYSVSVPQVEAEGALAEKVNAAIQEKVDLHLAKAQQDWEDYRKAFFATGGTEDEWGGREMDVTIDYEIKSQTEDRVSFVVSFAESWVSSYEERYYYNLDLGSDRELTLRDVLGENWVSVCNASIQEQIDGRVDADGFTEFFSPDEGGFTTVDENTSFYVREDGRAVVCFPKYSIAVGSAGNVEFVI